MTTANIITSLGAADVDTKQLTVDLVNAIREPRQKRIDDSKKKAEVAISSLALLKGGLSVLQTAATELGSVGKLNKLSISSSNSTVISAEAGGAGIAIPGNHTIKVQQLAQPARIASIEISNTTVALNQAGTLTLDKGIAITANMTAPQIVSKINSESDTVSARLVKIADGRHTIILEGQPGVANNFTATGLPLFPQTAYDSDLPAAGGVLQPATDSQFEINGVLMTRSSNILTDVLDGVTLRLQGVSAAGSSVRLGVSFDSSEITAAVKKFVESYNLIQEFIKSATGEAVAGDEVAGSLKNNSTVRTLQMGVRSALTKGHQIEGVDATHWSVLGVALDRNGVLQFKEESFNAAFSRDPTDVVRALSNNRTEPNIYSDTPSGLAGDMARVAFRMVRESGSLGEIEKSYKNKLDRVAKEQTKLDEQINAVRERYEQQFSSLNAVLARFKDTSKRLESSLNFNNKD